MGPRTTAIAGLLAGATAALALLLGVVLLLPEPSDHGTASPSPATSASSVPKTSPATSAGPASSVAISVGTTGSHVGQSAPALTVPQLGGGQISLTSLAGRPVWVTFIQTTCPPCVAELPLLSGFAARYANSGLVVIAVDVREDEGIVAAFVQSLNSSFPVGLDTSGAMAQAWDAVALPVNFWVDREGIIRAGSPGGIGPDIMAKNLQTILPGVSVTP